MTKNKNISTQLALLESSCALVYPHLQFLSMGTPIGTKWKLGQKNFFERSRKPFNRFRASAGIIFILLIVPSIYCVPSLETAMEYQQNEQYDKAISCYEEIILNEPDNIQAHFNLGGCYLALGDYEKAIAAFDNTLALNAEALPALYNKAFTYKTMGNIDTAIELYKQIICTNPEYEPAQLGLGFAYITQGNFDLGWEQHTRYLKQSGKNGDALRSLLSSNAVAHKTILLRPEGGLGDTLNFVRYAERLKNMGATVIVACQKPLIPLLSRCTYIDQLIPCGTSIEYNAEATLMSLPAIFNDDENTVPNKIPYLFADPALVTYWEKTTCC